MYLHQAILVPLLVPSIVQEQAGTALLRDDASDEGRVQAQVSGYSLNRNLVSPQTYYVCLSSPPYHGKSCGIGKGRLTHPTTAHFPLEQVYQRNNSSFEENIETSTALSALTVDRELQRQYPRMTRGIEQLLSS